MDQWLVAGVSVFVFSILCLIAYIAHEERKSRREPIDPILGPDTVETRNRRAF